MKILLMLITFIISPFRDNSSTNNNVQKLSFLDISIPRQQVKEFDITKLSETGLNEYYKVQ